MTTSIVPPMKRCTKCGEEKTLSAENFHRDKGKADGYREQCKTCRGVKTPRTDPGVIPDGMRFCAHCKQIRLEVDFYRNTLKGFQSECIECDRKRRRENADRVRQWRIEYYLLNGETIREKARVKYHSNKKMYQKKNRVYRETNKEILREKRRIHQKNHPISYRIRAHTYRTNRAKSGGSFTEKDVENMRIMQQDHCCYCGKIDYEMQVEHIIPVSQGGPSDAWNLALACKKCNSSKNGRTIEQWIKAGRWFD